MTVDVMAIGAHPDDVEIGMGGTIATLTAAGYRVVIVDLSDGEPTPHGTHEKRLAESRQSAEILGVEKRIILDMPNREIMDTIENRKKLASVIREFKPVRLFVPYWQDAHPDHIQASQLAQAARFYAKLGKTDMPHQPYYPEKIFHYFCVHMKLNFQPSFVFDISGKIQTKLNALEQYRSQFIDNNKNKYIFQMMKEENAYWGRQIRAKYGEPFVCLENIAINKPGCLLNV